MSAQSAPAGHLPLEGKATIQEYPLLKRRRSRHPVRPSAPQSTVIPSAAEESFIALPPYARMRSHSNDTLELPFSTFSHLRFTDLQEGSLHFSPHDTQERRMSHILFHTAA